MRMVIIVFRDLLQDEVLNLVQDCEIKAFTLIQNVAGVGETGQFLGSFASPGVNSMLLIVLPKEQAERCVEVLKAFRDGLADDHPTRKVPIRAFMLPCAQVV